MLRFKRVATSQTPNKLIGYEFLIDEQRAASAQVEVIENTAYIKNLKVFLEFEGAYEQFFYRSLARAAVESGAQKVQAPLEGLKILTQYGFKEKEGCYVLNSHELNFESNCGCNN